MCSGRVTPTTLRFWPGVKQQTNRRTADSPTVSLNVTSVVACTYGCDDGRISQTRCAVIAAGLGDRCRPRRACSTRPRSNGEMIYYVLQHISHYPALASGPPRGPHGSEQKYVQKEAATRRRRNELDWQSFGVIADRLFVASVYSLYADRSESARRCSEGRAGLLQPPEGRIREFPVQPGAK